MNETESRAQLGRNTPLLPCGVERGSCMPGGGGGAEMPKKRKGYGFKRLLYFFKKIKIF